MSNRREFIKTLLAGGGAIVVAPGLLSGNSITGAVRQALQQNSTADEAWSQAQKILARIKPPVFPKRDFDITRYGAVGDGQKDCTEAFQKAIAACNRAGGGRVVVPTGSFLTAPLHLKSNANLPATKNATLTSSPYPRKYRP